MLLLGHPGHEKVAWFEIPMWMILCEFDQTLQEADLQHAFGLCCEARVKLEVQHIDQYQRWVLSP